MDRARAGCVFKFSKSFILWATVLATLLGAAAIWGANKQSLGLFHDDGIYVVVAKAISQDDGYRIISLPTSPPQTKYPFLYSYLLSWLWSLNPVFPGNILLLKSFNVAVLVAIFLVAGGFYRRVFPAAGVGALVFAVLICTNPIVFTYTDYVLSDLLFVLLVLAALFVTRGSADSSTTVLGLAVIAGLACLARLAAAPVVLGGAAVSFVRRGAQGLVCFICAIVVLIAPWIYWVWTQHPASTYSLLGYYSAYDFASGRSAGVQEWVAGHGTIVSGNAHYLLGSFDLLYLLPLMPALTPFVVALTLLGMAISRRGEDLFAWIFFVASVFLLLVWPFHPGRYVAPLVPLLVLFLFRGMAATEHWLESLGKDYLFKPLVTKLAWTPAVLLLLLNGVWLSSYLLIRDEQTTRAGYGRRMPYGWGGFEESFTWIRENSATDARLATAYDPMYFLYTGRQAIRPALHRSATYFYPYGRPKPDVGSVAEIKAELDAFSIDYLIIDPMDGYAEGKATIQLIEELVASYGEKARKVFTSTDGKHRIYALAR
jgi:hypothetical protein